MHDRRPETLTFRLNDTILHIVGHQMSILSNIRFTVLKLQTRRRCMNRVHRIHGLSLCITVLNREHHIFTNNILSGKMHTILYILQYSITANITDNITDNIYYGLYISLAPLKYHLVER